MPMNYGSDAALQEYTARQVKGVGEVMMSPTDSSGKPWKGLKRSRLFRGGSEALRIKMESPWTRGKRGKDYDQGALASGLAKGLRLFGRQSQAEWIDRLTATRKPDKAAKETDKKVSKTQEIVQTQQGVLMRIDAKVNAIHGMVQAQGGLINDIHSMLTPKDMGKGEKSSMSIVDAQGNPMTSLSKKSIAEEIAEEITTLQSKEELIRTKKAQLMLKKQAVTGGPYMDPSEGADPITVLANEVRKLREQVEKGGEEPPDDGEGWISKVLKFFATVGKNFLPFLKSFGMILGRMGGIGLAAWLGYELGKWLNEKFKISERIVDAVFAIKEWWEGLDIRGMFTEMRESLVETWTNFKDNMFDKFYEIKDFIAQKIIDLRVWIHDINPFTNEDETEKFRQSLQADLDETKAARLKERQQRENEKQREKYTAKLGESTSLSSLQQQKVDLESAIDRTEDPKMRAFLLEQRRMTLEAMEKRAPGSAGNYRRPTGGGVTGNFTMLDKKKLPMPDKTLQDVITDAAKKVGVDQGLMLAMARQESSFNPKAEASTSSAKGLYQFIDSTWGDMLRKYGGQYPELGAGPMDPVASATAGALFIKENAEILKKAGIPLNASNLYTAHFLGAGGARTLLSAPADAIAADLLPAAAKANQGIFYDKHGRARTVSEVEGLMYDKIGKYADAYTAALGVDASKTSVMAGTPGQRINGVGVDMDSREVQQGQRGGAGGVVVTPAVMSHTNTVEKAPPQMGAPKANPATSDPSLQNAAYADQSFPMPA